MLGSPVEIMHVPGHSPDSLCFVHRERRLAFGGDVLFQGGIGRTDFPGGSMEQLVEGIRTKLFGLDEDVTVLPGHGPPTTIGAELADNPFVSPES